MWKRGDSSNYDSCSLTERQTLRSELHFHLFVGFLSSSFSLLVAQNCLDFPAPSIIFFFFFAGLFFFRLPTVASMLIASSFAYTYICFCLFVICFQWGAKANCGQISLLAMFGPNLPFLTFYTEEATGRRYKRASPRSASCSVTFLSKHCKLKTICRLLNSFLIRQRTLFVCSLCGETSCKSRLEFVQLMAT